MDELRKKLVNVGLSEKEAQVYLALLQTGKITAYKLAAKAEIKISTTYVILEELRKKDLVLKMPSAKRQLFSANDPTYFFQKLSRDVESLENVLPRLHALTKKKEDSAVITYEGHIGIKDALDYKFDSMEGKTFLGFYSALKKPDTKLLSLMVAWSEECLGRKVGSQVIAPESPASEKWIRETSQKYSHGIKLIDEKLWSSEISIEVADDFVRIVDTKDLQAVIVDNKKVAHAFREIFHMVWGGVEGEVRKPR